MTQKQKEQVGKFKKFTSWMCADISKAMFCAKANFLVAQGLVNYTETLGSFLCPYKTTKKGKVATTNTGERFLSFFARLGPEYQILLRGKCQAFIICFSVSGSDKKVNAGKRGREPFLGLGLGSGFLILRLLLACLTATLEMELDALGENFLNLGYSSAYGSLRAWRQS